MISWLTGSSWSLALVAMACLSEVPHAPDYLADDADCGNDVIDPGEECDRAAVGSSTCLELGYAGGELACQSDCTYDVSWCRAYPGVGQVVITEIMKQPVPDAEGIEEEWFEIFNPTHQMFDLSTCTVEGSPGEPGFLIDPEGHGLWLGPMEHRIISGDAGDPPPAIASWSSDEFGLSNDVPDIIRLECGGVVVDEVTYDDKTFPDAIGRSLALDPGAHDAVTNDDGARWCGCRGPNDDDYRYGYDEPYAFGTPSAANPECPASSASGAILFFSEYVDGEAPGDDALEIHNASEVPAGLRACEVWIYEAGATVPDRSIRLEGTIPSRSVTVLCNAGFFELERCDLLSNDLVFGGSETIVLVCDGSALDVFGRIGYDPGVEWDVDGVGTRQVTLRRSCETTMGDVDGMDAFDPSIEWIETSAVDFSDLERHYCH